jgi:uncharacterized protein YegP (UPF0339 family)
VNGAAVCVRPARGKDDGDTASRIRGATKGGAMATGRFVLERGRSGKYRFNLISTNGKVVATSEAYDTKRAAMSGIESVRKLASAARLEDRTEEASGPRAATPRAANAERTARPPRRRTTGTPAVELAPTPPPLPG